MQQDNTKILNNKNKGGHLRFFDLFMLSIRVFHTRPFRSMMTILGMSFGIGTVLFLVSLGYGMQSILIGKLASTEDSLITIEAFYPAESKLQITQDEIDSVSSIPESTEISAVAEFTSEIKIDSIPGFISAKSVDDNYFRLSGTGVDIGKTINKDKNSVVISSAALRMFDLPLDETILGKKVGLSIFYTDNNETKKETRIDIPNELSIKGIIVDDFQPPFIIISNKSIENSPPYFQNIFVKAKDINKINALRDALIDKGFLISARLDLVDQARKILTAITVVLVVFGVAALVVSAIGMINTMVIGFLERVFEIGIMKSLGATTNEIRNIFLMEALIMGILGGVGGIILGIGVGELFNFGINVLASQLGGNPVDLFIYPIKFIILIVVMAAFVGILSGLWPSKMAAKLSPKEAFSGK